MKNIFLILISILSYTIHSQDITELEKEKSKKEESVAKQIAMQEARIKSLEADISKWKKKKEEVEIARKYDEDRFFKFKQNTSK